MTTIREDFEKQLAALRNFDDTGDRSAVELIADTIAMLRAVIYSDIGKFAASTPFSDAAIERAEAAERDSDQLRRELAVVAGYAKIASAERDELIDAAAHAIPEAEHPRDKTPHNWAWQIRQLGHDRRAAYKQRDEARNEANTLRGSLERAKRDMDAMIAAEKKSYTDIERALGKTVHERDVLIGSIAIFFPDAKPAEKETAADHWAFLIRKLGNDLIELRSARAQLRIDNTRLSDALERATKALSRDKTGLAAALNRIRKTVSARMWLLDGRGAYEWDDDKYKEEAGIAMREVLEIVGEALNASGTLAGIEVQAAHDAQKAMDAENKKLRDALTLISKTTFPGNYVFDINHSLALRQVVEIATEALK